MNARKVDNLNALIKEYDRTHSIVKVASKFSISSSTAWRWLKRAGVNCINNQPIVNVEAILNLYEDGVSMSIISKAFKISTETVYRHVKAADILRTKSQSWNPKSAHEWTPEQRKAKSIQMTGRPAWNNRGQRFVGAQGYWMIKVGGKLKFEHRYLMEQKLGRKLERSEHVHHKDENKLNNSPDNLELMTVEEHMSHHRKAYDHLLGRAA